MTWEEIEKLRGRYYSIQNGYRRLTKEQFEEEKNIETAPSDSPHCRYCGRPMSPNYITIFCRVGEKLKVVKRIFLGNYGYKGNNLFCSQSHGFKWAVNFIKLR